MIQSNDRLRCVSILGYILSPHPSKIVIEHLNILLVPEVNKLLGYLSETNHHQVGENLRNDIESNIQIVAEYGMEKRKYLHDPSFYLCLDHIYRSL